MVKLLRKVMMQDTDFDGYILGRRKCTMLKLHNV